MDEIAYVSAVTEAEIRYGLEKRPEATALRGLLEEFLSCITILPWGRGEARAYGSMRARLETGGRVLGSMDMMIAAHAIATGSVLVTSDRAIAQFGGLRASENWATDLRND